MGGKACTRWRRWLAACLLFMGAPLALQAATWVRAESPHFVIVSTGSESQAREYVRVLEAFRQAVLPMFGAQPGQARAQSRFELHLLGSPGDLAQVHPSLASGFGGVFIRCAEGSAAFAVRSRSPNLLLSEADRGLNTVLHEYVHRLMSQYAATGFPVWYSEGLADYLATARVREHAIDFGAGESGRAYILNNRPWIGFESVLNPAFRLLGEAAAEPLDVQRFYAQSWLLTHYLFSDAQRARALTAYLVRIGAGEDAVAAFEPATGVPVAALPRLLRRHFAALPVVTISTRGLPEPAIRVQAVPAEESAWVLPAAVLRSCPERPHGEALLAELQRGRGRAAGRPPALLRLALARAELLFGSVDAARRELEALLEADDASFEGHYLMARVWQRAAEGLEGEARREALDQARSYHFKAYRIERLDAPNLYFLAQLLLQRGESGATLLNAAQGARHLQPLQPEYVWLDLRVSLAAGQRERAVAALQPLASNPHDPQSGERVRKAIALVQAGAGVEAVLAAIEPPKTKDPAQ